jgi:hypothetical protein
VVGGPGQPESLYECSPAYPIGHAGRSGVVRLVRPPGMGETGTTRVPSYGAR